MTPIISTNGELLPDLGERCRALEQECQELRERLASLENPPPKPRRRIRAIVADGLFVLLAALVLAATVGAVAIATGLVELQSDPETESALPAADSQAAEQESSAPPTGEAQSTPAEDGPFAGGDVTATTGAEAAGTVPAEAAASVPVRLTASAVGGACWLQIRRGGADGAVEWEGVLPDGDSVEFEGKRFWMRIGDPTNLRLVVNGERVRDLPTLAADLLITKDGVRVVPTVG